jgi:hypothetical protein
MGANRCSPRMDFIIMEIKRKGKRNIPGIFQNLNVKRYLENQSKVPGIIFRLFMSKGLCWCQLFLPTVSFGTTVRRDPDGWNTVIFLSGWVVVSWVRFYRIDSISIQTWFAFFWKPGSKESQS